MTGHRVRPLLAIILVALVCAGCGGRFPNDLKPGDVFETLPTRDAGE